MYLIMLEFVGGMQMYLAGINDDLSTLWSDTQMGAIEYGTQHAAEKVHYHLIDILPKINTDVRISIVPLSEQDDSDEEFFC